MSAIALAPTGTTGAIVRSVGGDGSDEPPGDARLAVVRALAAHRHPEEIAGSVRCVSRTLGVAPGVQREVISFEGAADLARQRFQARGRIAPGDEGTAPREYESFVFSEWEFQRSLELGRLPDLVSPRRPSTSTPRGWTSAARRTRPGQGRSPSPSW